MKHGFLLFALILSSSAFAGQFVQKNMYTKAHLAVGIAETDELALKDAQSAIPTENKLHFYEADTKENSPQIQCLNGVTWAKKTQCQGGHVQYVIPLKQVTR